MLLDTSSGELVAVHEMRTERERERERQLV